MSGYAIYKKSTNLKDEYGTRKIKRDHADEENVLYNILIYRFHFLKD